MTTTVRITHYGHTCALARLRGGTRILGEHAVVHPDLPNVPKNAYQAGNLLRGGELNYGYCPIP
jgi:hypothetical protein